MVAGDLKVSSKISKISLTRMSVRGERKKEKKRGRTKYSWDLIKYLLWWRGSSQLQHQLFSENVALSPLRHCIFQLTLLMAFQVLGKLDMLQKAFWGEMVITYVQPIICPTFFRSKNIWNSQTRMECVWNEESVKGAIPSVHLEKSHVYGKTVGPSYVEAGGNPF